MSPNNYILIDGSYFIFYRYYALNVWWSHAGETPLPQAQVQQIELLGETLPILDAVHINGGQGGVSPLFIEKFKSTFVSKIHEIDKKLKL